MRYMKRCVRIHMCIYIYIYMCCVYMRCINTQLSRPFHKCISKQALCRRCHNIGRHSRGRQRVIQSTDMRAQHQMNAKSTYVCVFVEHINSLFPIIYICTTHNKELCIKRIKLKGSDNKYTYTMYVYISALCAYKENLIFFC